MPRSGQLWDGEFGRRSPLFRVYEDLTGRFAAAPDWPSLTDYTELCERERRARAPELRPLVFANAPKKSRRARRERVVLHELYDGSIELAGQVPCLVESYHDLWNAVIFAAFPRAKRALHARQYRALASWAIPGARSLPSRRTRQQDALTVFDEGGSVVLLTPALHARWRESTEAISIHPEPTPLCAPVIFGHALLELSQYQLPVIRSSALVFVVPELPSGPELFECIDPLLASRLADPEHFTVPGGDAVLELDREGGMTLGPPRPVG